MSLPLEEEDVLRPPESSGDEEENIPPATTTTTTKKRSIAEISGSTTRASTKSARAAKRQRVLVPCDLSEGRLEASSGAQSLQIPTLEEMGWASSTSQKSKSYANKSSQRNTALKPPPSFESSPPQQQNSMILLGQISSPQALRASKNKADAGPSQADLPVSSLTIPSFDDDDDDTFPAESPSTPRDNILLGGRGYDSSSPLSSASSVIELQLDPDQISRLNNDTPQIDLLNNFKCPSCHRVTPRRGLNFPKHISHPSQLSISQLSSFCKKHRLRDAHTTWQEKGYPDTSWLSTPSSSTAARLQTHIDRIVKIITRKHNSFYYDKLLAALEDAKGNQSKLQAYINVQTLHNGYYGPKGAKLIAQCLSGNRDIHSVLNKVIKKDSKLRTIGTSRFLAIVGVPEIITGLVAGDMGVNEERARQICEESGEVGVLLCPEDDIVRREDDEDGELI